MSVVCLENTLGLHPPQRPKESLGSAFGACGADLHPLPTPPLVSGKAVSGIQTTCDSA